MHQPTKTVVVLGASYAGKSETCHVYRIHPTHTPSYLTGHRAVHQLVEKLPEDWRVVVVERNTYVLLSSRFFCLLWTNLNALGTSTVSRIASKSFSALLLISAPNLICPLSQTCIHYRVSLYCGVMNTKPVSDVRSTLTAVQNLTHWLSHPVHEAIQAKGLPWLCPCHRPTGAGPVS